MRKVILKSDSGSKLDLFVPRDCYPPAKVEVWGRGGRAKMLNLGLQSFRKPQLPRDQIPTGQDIKIHLCVGAFCLGTCMEHGSLLPHSLSFDSHLLGSNLVPKPLL